MDDSKEIVSFRHSKTDAHMNLQSLWPHTQDLHRAKLDCVSILRGRSRYGLPSLTK